MKFLKFTDDSGDILINPEYFAFAEVDDNCTVIHLVDDYDQTITVNESMAEVAKQLEEVDA